MTIKEFISILQSNNIPDDAILMSDCDWEIHATTIGAVYYCKEENIIALTQNDAYPIRMLMIGPRKQVNEFANGYYLINFNQNNIPAEQSPPVYF